MERCISEAVIWKRLKNKNTNKWNLCTAEKRRWQRRGEGKGRESGGAEEEEKGVIRNVHREGLDRWATTTQTGLTKLPAVTA